MNLDDLVYLYTNTGSFEEGYLNEEECKERVAKEIEAESHYKYTHCYPCSGKMTLEEFICKHICRQPHLASNTAQNRIKNMKLEYTDENFKKEFNEVLNSACSKCPIHKFRETNNK